MKIYNYHPTTKEYLGEEEARLDPLEFKKGKTVYLLPANATFDAPPAHDKGTTRCFIDGKWVNIEDHRGETVYDIKTGKALIVDAIGQISTGYTKKPKPSGIHIWDEKTEEWVEDEKMKKDKIQTELENEIRELDIKSISAIRAYILGDETEKKEAIKLLSEHKNRINTIKAEV
jgi:hypothetical protein